MNSSIWIKISPRRQTQITIISTKISSIIIANWITITKDHTAKITKAIYSNLITAIVKWTILIITKELIRKIVEIIRIRTIKVWISSKIKDIRHFILIKMKTLYINHWKNIKIYFKDRKKYCLEFELFLILIYKKNKNKNIFLNLLFIFNILLKKNKK